MAENFYSKNGFNDKGFDEMRKELKNLPQIKVPDDFEVKLRHRISKIKTKERPSIWERIFFPAYSSHTRVMIYSTVSIILICAVALIYMIFRNFPAEKVIDSSRIDSTVYNGKKVLILPPTSSDQSYQTGQQPLKESHEKTNKVEINKDKIDEYFAPPSVQKEESKGLTTMIVTDSSVFPKLDILNQKTTGKEIEKTASFKKKDTLTKKISTKSRKK